jgi:hypothetical protein
MKMNKSIVFFLIVILASLSSCTKDGEFETQNVSKTFFAEDFTGSSDNTILDTKDWTNYAEAGTKVWSEQDFSGNGYAEFSSFGSGQAVNVGWLISPPLDMETQTGEKLFFQSAQNFLRSRENALELLVSTDYDGVNFALASWENIPIITPTPDSPRYTFINSGIIDLSSFKGTLHFAFRVKGSGTNSNLTGTYQIDNIKIFY